MRLSIVMMVKNEEKHLEECLRSLEGVRAEIKSELIILDTGSTDRTVEIAKRYTDNVFFKEWNDNFGAMRNASISYAKGEWLLVIDGDEVVDDASDLIDFFKSSKYKKYNTATLRLENYFGGKVSSSSSQCRLFKRTKEFRYKGAIHEQPMRIEPIAYLRTNMKHYGYDMTDIALKERKFIRNTEILLKEIEKQPDYIYYWFQLGQSYCAYDEYKKGLEAVAKALDIAKEKDIDKLKTIFLYVYLIKIYYWTEKYDELEKIGNELLDISDEYLDSHFFIGKALQQLQKYDAAIVAYNKYISMVFHYEDFRGYNDITTETATLNAYENAYGNLCLLYNKVSKHQEVIETALKIKDNSVLLEVLGHIIDSFVKVKDYQGLRNFYESRICGLEDNLLKKFASSLEKAKQLLSEDETHRLIQEYAQGNDIYSVLNKIRLEEIEGSLELTREYRNLIESLDFSLLPMEYGEVIYYLLRRGYNIAELLKNTRMSIVEGYLMYIVKKFKWEYAKLTVYLIKDLKLGNLSFHERRIWKLLAKSIINTDLLLDADYVVAFNAYVTLNIEYIKDTVNMNLIQLEMVSDVHDNEAAFGIYMYHAEKYIAHNKVKYIQYLRKAINSYPEMKRGIELLLKNIQETAIPTNLIEVEAKRVKEGIKLLLEEGKAEAAASVVAEYEKILPSDADMYSFKLIIALIHNDLLTAEENLLKGLAIDEKNGDLLYNGGYILSLKKDYSGAMTYYEKALEIIQDEDARREIDLKIMELQVLNDGNLNGCEDILPAKPLDEYESHKQMLKEHIRVSKDKDNKGILPIIDEYLEIVPEDLEVLLWKAELL